MAPLVLDQPAALEDARHERDRRSACADHVGKKLLRQWNISAVKPVMGHKEPTGEPLLPVVDPVTGRELGEHPALILRITKDEPA